MKNVSFPQFLDHVQAGRQARGLAPASLQDTTFLHDITHDPKATLDLLEEVIQKLNIPITRSSLKTDYLSPYLRYNLQDLYDAFGRLEADIKFQRNRKIWFGIGFALMGATLYEFCVEVAVVQSILLATVTSAIFQYLFSHSS